MVRADVGETGGDSSRYLRDRMVFATPTRSVENRAESQDSVTFRSVASHPSIYAPPALHDVTTIITRYTTSLNPLPHLQLEPR